MRSSVKHRVFAAISIFIGIVAACGIGEVLFRFFFPQFAYGYPRGLFVADEQIGYRFKPNYKGGYLTKQEFSTPVWTNSEGFRDEERSYAKPSDTFRILSIGDSFTWGAYGATADQTFSAVLEHRLNSFPAEPRYEVANMGVVGWGTDNEFQFYTHYGIKYDHDLVLVNLYVGNDLFDNMKWGEISVVDGNLVNTFNLPGSVFSIKNLRALALEHSYLASAMEISLFQIPLAQRLMSSILTGGETQDVYYGDHFDALVGTSRPALYLKMLRKTENLLRDFNAHARGSTKCFLLVLIPAIYQADETIAHAIYQEHHADSQSIIKVVNDLKRLGESEGFPIIDLLPKFREEIRHGRQIYWKFNPHFTPYGNEVAADVILSELKAVADCRFPLCTSADRNRREQDRECFKRAD
jgi:hypothetical protein